MLCTAGRGGMRAVVEAYRRDGLFDRWPVQLIETHDEGSAWRRIGIAVCAFLAFTRLLFGRRVIAVHAHVAMRGSFWRKSIFASTARRFGVPVVMHLHGSEMQPFFHSQPAWRQRLIVAQLEAAATVLVLSRSWADFVRQIAPRARVMELPNYVMLPPGQRRELDPGRPVTLLFLGLVGPRKGVFDLLPAFAGALRRAPALRLQVGGNGDVEGARLSAQQLGLKDEVEFLGWIAGDAKNALLSAADIYVLPSHNEGLPMSVLEAMAYGLPIITTRVGGIPELIRDGTDGWLIEPGDRAALEEAMVALASDAGLRARLGAAARERISHGYSGAAILPKLEAVYRDLHTAR